MSQFSFLLCSFFLVGIQSISVALKDGMAEEEEEEEARLLMEKEAAAVVESASSGDERVFFTDDGEVELSGTVS